MKVVKLNKTHSLYHEGFTHAFRFPKYEIEAGRIERIAYHYFGSHWLARDPTWTARFGHRDSTTGLRVYWIAFKDEAMISMVLLKL